MKKINAFSKNILGKIKQGSNQEGTATIIAVMIMSLLTGFVALAISRTTNETMAMSNDIAETRAFSAAQASLENMTLNADSKFDIKLDLNSTDEAQIKASKPEGFTEYEFKQTIQKIRTGEVVDATGETFQGLKQIRDEWELSAAVSDPKTSVQSILRRRFFNNRIPLFQFGIFYDDDLEFHPGPRFDFGGRVHSNGNLFLSASTGLYFSSKVSATKDIVTDIARNGDSWNKWGENVYVKSGQGVYVKLDHTKGSAQNGVVNGVNLYAGNADFPALYETANWDVISKPFGGNLISRLKRLDLPIRLAAGGNQIDYFELVKRGKDVGDKWNDGTGTVSAPSISPVNSTNADSIITSQQRYSNGSGIRVSLSDSQDRLPGCATTPANCGVRLDGTYGGTVGYLPLALKNGTQATRLNGERFAVTGKQMWIKVELVNNDRSAGTITANDITQDILSLGITEQAPTITGTVNGNPYTYFSVTGSDRDSRSIIKLQRFVMPGSVIKSNSAYLTDYNWDGKNYNFAVTDDANAATLVDDINPNTGLADLSARQVSASILGGTKTVKVVPYPIMMFDTREGVYDYDLSLNTANLPRNGVMSMVDIDVNNLRRFFNGEFDNLLPTTGTPYTVSTSGISLKSSSVPQDRGWVFYVSDRRGDFDFDGEYDMEDIYGNNDGILQYGEDINKNGTLQANYGTLAANYTDAEAPRYSDTWSPDVASVVNTKYYRRGVRLTNGTIIPGIYDSDTPQYTKGFAFASENGVYVKGNYNATGVSYQGTPTAAIGFLPQNTVEHIPASISADAITALSNAWQDSNSFSSPYSTSARNADDTTMRFAMLAGDPMSSLKAEPDQGGSDKRLGGGVHNFKRFLEDWNSNYLNYSGSLINMFNSHNSNGTFKCCSKVYSPPNRNWVFDTTFLDPNRLPPATPFFQSISLTGFQRVNE
jgi:hypothetical protein